MHTVSPAPDLNSASRLQPGPTQIRIHEAVNVEQDLQRLTAAVVRHGEFRFSHRPDWLLVLRDGLGHPTFLLEAVQNQQSVGWLPLAFVNSRLFGRFLVSLPYLNSAGIATASASVGDALVDRAIRLADELDVRYLELRHEQRCLHPALNGESTSKMHLRLSLPPTADELWRELDPKVRNQIRKGQKHQLTVHWGGIECLNDFYAVFSRNMRDLGTPTFGRRLFQSILERFPDCAELCVVRSAGRPVAAALLLHGAGVTEVPSASSLRQFNSTNANMLLYWHLLCRAVERNQHTFDFGRSSRDSNTYRFKLQWGAQPHPAIWQYYLRRGSIDEMRPTSPRYQRMIEIWKRLPVWLTRWIGPAIVRGIP
jgi:FemAB-related protein (PEP-CTERM system-associated)